MVTVYESLDCKNIVSYFCVPSTFLGGLTYMKHEHFSQANLFFMFQDSIYTYRAKARFKVQ
jgi:hypothetical protein